VFARRRARRCATARRAARAGWVALLFRASSRGASAGRCSPACAPGGLRATSPSRRSPHPRPR
jgi:hypothetical protein